MTTEHITACIDGSAISSVVCETAAWASQVLNSPLQLLHVLEKAQTHDTDDLSGKIGLGSREHLLEELIELEAKRNKLAVEHGKHILEDAQELAEQAGALNVETLQRHDQLIDALLASEDDTRLFVIGRTGGDHDIQNRVIGSHVENVVRAIHTPILMATGTFREPSNYMLAYDGSDTSIRAIQRIAESPLLAKLPGHLVMVGEKTLGNRHRLESAASLLSESGHQIHAHLIQGEVVSALLGFQNEHDIDLKVMGAYGHSRIREFIVGSHTTKMLATSTVPVLILR